MPKVLIILLILLGSFSANCEEKFGSPITLKNSMPINKALDNIVPNKEVLVTAKVGKVCKKKGCWMTLETKKNDFRVTFKDYAFFVPTSLLGKNVLVQGVLSKKTMTLAETKHFAEDEGKDPRKVTRPRVEYRMVASGLKVIKN